MKNNSNEQVDVLIESMFTFADQGIDPSVLCETTIPEIDNVDCHSLLEDTAEAAGLFAKLNQGRKDLLKSIQNIDWKEWVKKMKETLAKIWRFITAPARTLKELVTGKTTLREIGTRIKTVWSNLRNKKNKTPEEKDAEPKLAAVAKDIEKAEEMVEQKIEAKEESGDTTNGLAKLSRIELVTRDKCKDNILKIVERTISNLISIYDSGMDLSNKHTGSTSSFNAYAEKHVYKILLNEIEENMSYTKFTWETERDHIIRMHEYISRFNNLKWLSLDIDKYYKDALSYTDHYGDQLAPMQIFVEIELSAKATCKLLERVVRSVVDSYRTEIKQDSQLNLQPNPANRKKTNDQKHKDISDELDQILDSLD